jgi:hypothetical protein
MARTSRAVGSKGGKLTKMENEIDSKFKLNTKPPYLHWSKPMANWKLLGFSP